MRRLNQDLKEGSFLRAYLLYGNEEYLIRSYAERLEKAAANGDTMNVSVVSGHDLSAETLSDFTDSMPFMAEKRVLVVKDSGIFKSTPDAFVRWIEGLPATACVIFTESEADKRSRGFKAVEKIGYCCRLDHPDEETLGKWILSSLKKRGLSITKGAYQKLLLYLDGDMENAKNELEKLTREIGMYVNNIVVTDVQASDQAMQVINETNQYLLDAGFPEMYAGNPYDWIFLWASCRESALQSFRFYWQLLSAEFSESGAA